MYNRYVPQSDGSFQRCRVSDDPPRQEQPRPEPRNEPSPAPDPVSSSPPPPPRQFQQRRCQKNNPPPRQDKRPEPQGGNVLQFFRQLLPRDFDTGDLLVVILLLLMSGDCQEDQNTALLTLALYLFM